MHVAPGLADGSKIMLSYATATVALAYTGKLAFQALKNEGLTALVLRSAVAIAFVCCFSERPPHQPVGVSEVQLIVGTTLLLLFGVAPAANGLMGGLLLQGLFFAPSDLPPYGMNVMTLLVPLFVTSALARRIIPDATAYVDIGYAQAFKWSLAYKRGVVIRVAYGLSIATAWVRKIRAGANFGAACRRVVLLEPLIDLGILAIAKSLHRFRIFTVVDTRPYSPV